MGFLEKLLGKVGQVERGAVRTAGRALGTIFNAGGGPAGAPRPARPLFQQSPAQQAFGLPIWRRDANPTPQPIGFNPANKETQDAINKASAIFQYTPKFRQILEAAQPEVLDSTNKVFGNSSLRKGTRAAGEYSYSALDKWLPYNRYVNNQSIPIDRKYAVPSVITHEGLHSAFQTDPETRADFAKAYNSGVTPQIQQYLARRTKNYSTRQTDFSDFSKLNPSMQTEAHSYLSEIPLYTNENLPDPIERYYRRYIDPNSVGSAYDTIYGVRRATYPGPSRGGDF